MGNYIFVMMGKTIRNKLLCLKNATERSVLMKIIIKTTITVIKIIAKIMFISTKFGCCTKKCLRFFFGDVEGLLLFKEDQALENVPFAATAVRITDHYKIRITGDKANGT